MRGPICDGLERRAHDPWLPGHLDHGIPVLATHGVVSAVCETISRDETGPVRYRPRRPACQARNRMSGPQGLGSDVAPKPACPAKDQKIHRTTLAQTLDNNRPQIDASRGGAPIRLEPQTRPLRTVGGPGSVRMWVMARFLSVGR